MTIRCQTISYSSYKLTLCFDFFHLRKSLINLSDKSWCDRLSKSKEVSKCKVLEMFFNLRVEVSPFIDDSFNVDILIVEINHPHTRNCGGWSVYQRVCFKNETSGTGETDSFSCWQCQNMIVIKNTVKRLDPFRINITVKNDPITTVTFYNIAGSWY